MANVNGFRMDDIVDLITDSVVRIDIDSMFALIRSVQPVKGIRPKIELMDLLSDSNY
jgi:hypothetical protein